MEYYEIVEEKSFAEALSKIGDTKQLDDVLTAVEWALARKPYVYSLIKGTEDLRLYKTRGFENIPACRIWFKIGEDNRVYLLMIEPIPEEE